MKDIADVALELKIGLFVRLLRGRVRVKRKLYGQYLVSSLISAA